MLLLLFSLLFYFLFLFCFFISYSCPSCYFALGRLDAPLMYESGWNKKLTYVLSFSRHGVVDSTAKYSRKLPEVLQRRGAAPAICERAAQAAIARHDEAMQRQYLSSGRAGPAVAAYVGASAVSTSSSAAAAAAASLPPTGKIKQCPNSKLSSNQQGLLHFS